jgi:cell division transport system permease protein
MRTTLLRHSLSEGFNNLIRHPLVTLASITTIALMLFLMGAFSIFSINANQMMTRAGQQPPIEITLDIGVSEELVQTVEADLAADTNVVEYHLYTPEENFEAFKSNLGQDELFADFSAEFIPYTFAVRLDDPSLSREFKAHVEGLPGVRRVDLELAVMEFLSKAIVWVNYATIVALTVLGIVSFLIISNMVRVAVFARGEEINIMKYVGATNWYIRIPYILEGAVAGLLGAGLATGLVFLAYRQIHNMYMVGIDESAVLAMVDPGQVLLRVLLLNLALGIGVGAIGSAISVRRHIKV